MLASRLQRLRASKASVVDSAASFLNWRRKASDSWSAVQDTYQSTKRVFEKHRVVFTISTSLASILTAWTGYSLRYLHQSKVEKRLQSIEETLKSSDEIKHEEIKRIVSSGSVSTAACVATAWTSLAIGCGLGWRGGCWYANRKFRKEQLRLLGQIKPKKWHILRRLSIQSQIFGTGPKPTGIRSSPAS